MWIKLSYTLWDALYWFLSGSLVIRCNSIIDANEEEDQQFAIGLAEIRFKLRIAIPIAVERSLGKCNKRTKQARSSVYLRDRQPDRWMVFSDDIISRAYYWMTFSTQNAIHSLKLFSLVAKSLRILLAKRTIFAADSSSLSLSISRCTVSMDPQSHAFWWHKTSMFG